MRISNKEQKTKPKNYKKKMIESESEEDLREWLRNR
jgi:hypothetical protein